MSFKATIIVTCLLLQSCAPVWNSHWGSRAPASAGNFEEAINKMKDFKARVMGSEQDSKCSKEQLDADFKKLLASVKKDSCSKDSFSINREEFDQKSCPKVKIEGYFDKIVKTTIKEEKEKKPLTFFQKKLDPEFDYFFMEAKSFLRTLNTLAANDSVTMEDRAALVAEYVENVLMPMRDIVIIKRSYLPQEQDGREFYLPLQPTLTDAFVRSLGQSEIGLLTQGPNPSSTPFYMELKETNNGQHLLSFSPTEIMRRDVLTLLKAPSSKNYVIALKWMTLHMMMSQVFLYDTILGNSSAVKIPNACQNHFNGNLPSEFKFNFEEGMGEQFLENILAGHGLTFKEDDLSYLDYYVENVSKDPTKDGYSALVPFENFKNAKMSLNPLSGGGLESQFDDLSHFQSVLNFKSGEAQSKFRGKIGKQNIVHNGHEIFQKLMGEFPKDEISEIKTADGSVQQIYSGKQNLSPYLLELMQTHGLLDYSQLVTERMKKKFLGKKALIDFPSMYSAPVWRDWSLKVLADSFHQYKDYPSYSEVHQVMDLACQGSVGSGNLEARQICSKGNKVQNLAAYLEEFRTGEKYIPTRRLEERKFQLVYPILNYVWANLRNNTQLLPEAKPFELNFLLEQMAAGNPWARLKMSYMVALDQLEHKKEGATPVFDLKGWAKKINVEAACDMKLITTQYNKLQEAGKVLGLDKPLTYNHAAKILSKSEKSQVWKNIYDDIQQRNAQLFSVRSGNKDFYQIAEDLSYKTILTKEAAMKTGIAVSQKAQADINKVSASTESQIGQFFLRLYQIKDSSIQKQLFEDFSKLNGIDNTFSLKLNFLALDDAYKKPIYKDLLRQAAQARKVQIVSHLETFCNMNINNEKEFKNIFYSTTKAQNELNQLAGLPAVPEEVLSKINEMSSDEWRDMWWGIGSGVAGMAAIVVGGACTTLSGGICAPLGGAMAVAGLASLGIQVKLTSNEIGRKVESDFSVKQVKMMEDLGFANTGSADEVHRSYAWTAFEAITIFPLIGVATRSLVLGPKLVYASAQSVMRQTGKTSFKAAAKSVTQEEEVRAARFLLGVDSVSKNAGIDAKTLSAANSKIERIRKLYTSGEITLETMVVQIGKVINPIKRAKLAALKTVKKEIGKVTVKESQSQIDVRTATMVSEYFANNPKEMLRLIAGYSGEKLNKAVRIMNEVNSVGRIGRVPVFGSMKDWFLRMRNEGLAKNAAKILRIEKELLALGGDTKLLKPFILKNMEDLTEIFIEIPLKKREIPYFVFVQGMPEFSFIKGRKIPLLSTMSEGQTMRRIFIARARLVHESHKAQARITLKLKKYVQSETTQGVYRAFALSVAEMASKKSTPEAAKIMADFNKVHQKIITQLHDEFAKQYGKKLDSKAFNRFMLDPITPQDKAMAEALWESIPADKLMGMRELGEFAHKAVQELSKYSDVDSFERYLGALKILTINRNPAVLEIM